MIDNTQIIEMYTVKHLSPGSIAKLVGCDRDTIYRNLVKIGIQIRNHAEAAKYRDSKYEWSDLRKLYIDDELSSPQIADIKGCDQQLVRYQCKRQGIPLRTISEGLKIAFKKGRKTSSFEKNPNYKGGRRPHGEGYILLLMPDHHRAGKDGYVLEHIVVWEQVHGCPVPEGYHVHHLNGIRTDNRPSNLVALSPRKHGLKRKTLDDSRKQKIRELEAEVSLLKRALEKSQSMFYIGEN
jgi:predicted DNA-binding protein YlxM (UPF0122 family)